MLYSLVGKIEYSLFNDVGCSNPTATAVYYRKYPFVKITLKGKQSAYMCDMIVYLFGDICMNMYTYN